MAITWQNITAPSFEGVASLARAGGDRASEGLKDLGALMTGVHKDKVRANTDAALAQMMQYGDPAALKAAGGDLMNTPGVDARVLMQALNNREKDLIANKGGMLNNIAQANENGVFQKNHQLNVQSKEADIRNANLLGDGRVIDNRFAPTLKEQQVAKGGIDIARGNQGLQSDITKNKYLDPSLQTALRTDRAKASTAETDSKYREQQVLSGLSNDATQRAVSKGNLAVSQSRLAHTKARDMADMQMKMAKTASDFKMAEQQQSVLDEFAGYKQRGETVPANMWGKMRTAGVPKDQVKLIQDEYKREEGTSKGVGRTPAFQTAFKSASTDTKIAMDKMVDKIRNNSMVMPGIKGKGDITLTNDKLKDFQNWLAVKATGPFEWLGANDLESDSKSILKYFNEYREETGQ